jgi:hypothetical protein
LLCAARALLARHSLFRKPSEKRELKNPTTALFGLSKNACSKYTDIRNSLLSDQADDPRGSPLFCSSRAGRRQWCLSWLFRRGLEADEATSSSFDQGWRTERVSDRGTTDKSSCFGCVAMTALAATAAALPYWIIVSFLTFSSFQDRDRRAAARSRLSPRRLYR